MQIQIRKISVEPASGSVLRGDHLYVQNIEDSEAIFAKIVSFANTLVLGTTQELSIGFKGRLFLFAADNIDVKTVVMLANGIKTRKVSDKVDTSTTTSVATAVADTNAPAPATN